jgi:hypothetical protein
MKCDRSLPLEFQELKTILGKESCPQPKNLFFPCLCVKRELGVVELVKFFVLDIVNK